MLSSPFYTLPKKWGLSNWSIQKSSRLTALKRLPEGFCWIVSIWLISNSLLTVQYHVYKAIRISPHKKKLMIKTKLFNYLFVQAPGDHLPYQLPAHGGGQGQVRRQLGEGELHCISHFLFLLIFGYLSFYCFGRVERGCGGII